MFPWWKFSIAKFFFKFLFELLSWSLCLLRPFLQQCRYFFFKNYPCPQLLGNKNSILMALAAACILHKNWRSSQILNLSEQQNRCVQQIWICCFNVWPTWLMTISQKYSVCSMNTKPDLMETDHCGSSNVSMCLFESSWRYMYCVCRHTHVYIHISPDFACSVPPRDRMSLHTWPKNFQGNKLY